MKPCYSSVPNEVTAYVDDCCYKITMFLEIFRKFFVLFICCLSASYAQVADNVTAIELSATTFPIERPFTISVHIGNSETRPVLAFPDIPGLLKKGIQTTVTAPENNDKKRTNQVITQTYEARKAGRFILGPFVVKVNGEELKSEGAVLQVQPSARASGPSSTTLVGSTSSPGAAFLTLRLSKRVVYTGEGVGLTLSFFVADNYPYVLSFTAVDRQLQSIIKKIRPANTWEENRPINELKPKPVLIGGRKFREIRLYQSVFYPLTARRLTLPAITLHLSRPRPNIGPPTSEAETVAFTSRPISVSVRALPSHPLRGQIAVGSFRLNERLDKQRVSIGQSVRYVFAIEGEGNVAMLPVPSIPPKTADIDVFPPEEHHTVHHNGNQVSGRKTFTFFIVPRQNGSISLGNYFQWIYFDPQRAKYDTLRSQLQMQAGGNEALAEAKTPKPTETTLLAINAPLSLAQGQSIYAGVKELDSTHQPISVPVLIRAMANVLIVLMLLGMIFMFFKK
ncbi:MAG: hypothetical protein JWP57_3566 [Spirosoma sp.]|nr:hypothetical protein [Spirosoma sp.]